MTKRFATFRPLILFAVLLIAAFSSIAFARSDSPLSLIPQPASIARERGTFTLGNGAPVVVQSRNAEAAAVARQFVERVAATRGLHLDLRPFDSAPSRDAIVFELGPAAYVKSDEGYALVVSSRGIRVIARAPQGLFYGAVTLWQLVTLDDAKANRVELPCLRIDDSPRFVWRGLMLDVARHYMPPDSIKQLIDWMALHKLNVFQWHLTDDQGWRIEIKKYPRLTETGARSVLPPPTGIAGSAADVRVQPRPNFYTQDEVRDIVRYAAARYVTVVPEIEMPGHAQAAIAAYPALGVLGTNPGVSPDWGVHTYLFNVDESTFGFIDDVLTEVLELFPSRYIHVGGDEAAKDQWQASAHVQARMRELGVPNEVALQSYFIKRVEKFLAAHGRKLVGWDEILEGGLPPEATVMSWRGTQGAIDAARQGHDVVLAPQPTLYFDHVQAIGRDEAPGRFGPVTLEDVYAFQPLPPELSADEARHVLGAQANVWAEHMRTPERAQRAAFPRAVALAEVLWSPAETHDWNSFAARMPAELQRLSTLGVPYATSAVDVRIAAESLAATAKARITLSTQAKVGSIRYTLDGREPRADSKAYEAPFDVSLPTEVRAIAFVDGRAIGKSQRRTVDALALSRRTSDELVHCANALPLRLEDDAPMEGTRAMFDVDVMNACWMYRGANLSGVGSLRAVVGGLPFNFQLWHDAAHVVRRAPTTKDGELIVRADSCEGETLATISLAPARAEPALTTLDAPLRTREGVHDLCFYFTSTASDPLWAIDSVQLLPR